MMWKLFATVLTAFCFNPGLAANHPAIQHQFKLVSIHPSIGTVLDSTENKTYGLFPRDAGVIAVRFFQISVSSWRVQIAGEKDGKPWLLIQRMAELGHKRLQRRIAEVDEKLAAGEQSAFMEPLLKADVAGGFDASQPMEIRLSDGSAFNGHITGVSEEHIEFTTLVGALSRLPAEKISEVLVPKGQFSEGRFVRYDPNDIRLFFGATGRTMRRGEGNIADFYVFFPTIAFGITDDFQVGGGMSLIPGASNQLFYVSPKLRLAKNKDFDLAAGLLYMGMPGEFDIGAAYSSISIGNPLGGVTLGAAYPFATDGDVDSHLSFLFGAEKQMSSSVKFITENWLFTGEEDLLLFSAGFRFIGDRLTVGLGFFTFEDLLESSSFPIVPWLDFSLSFGR